MGILVLIATLLILTSPALASPSAEVTWRYERAEDAQIDRGARSVAIPPARGAERASTDRGMEKTILLVEVANGTLGSLERYESACLRRRPPILLPERPEPRELPTQPSCEAARIALGETLQKEIGRWSARVSGSELIRADAEVTEALDVLRKLAENMKNAEDPAGGFEEDAFLMRNFSSGPLAVGPGAMASGGLNVTGGGAQDFGYFRLLVESGQVPRADVLTVEGFLREFDLPLLDVGSCAELICVNPAVSVDAAAGRLYVQIGMSSSVTPEAFERRPLNLSVVLDVSGSMSATDGTEKSRLEWAKDALIQTIGELDADDMLSIVVFDTTSEILLRPERVQDKESIIDKVRSLQTRDSTNLEAGLRDGYQLVGEFADRLRGYEHRVILISDAGLNTGVTDPASLLRLVTNHASEGIGLTALGLGENFNQDFIHGITNSRGGNYLFVHSGEDMLRYFDAFEYLVTPVAYDFRVQLALNGIQAKLVAAHGVPTEAGTQPVRDIIDLETLFFSEEGGAILLEYELPARR